MALVTSLRRHWFQADCPKLIKGARPEVAEGHVIWKAADIDFGVAITTRIAATDEHTASPAMCTRSDSKRFRTLEAGAG
jgi:hypothetical protein